MRAQKGNQHVADPNRAGGNSTGVTFISVLIVVAVLYFARTVFIPLALAVLVAFLLGPLVIHLKHSGLGRMPSTLIVVVLAFSLVGFLGMLVSVQLGDLAHKLPGYQSNVHQKMGKLRASSGGLVRKVTRITHSVTEELTPTNAEPATATGAEKPVPVEIRKSPFSPVELVQKILGSVVEIAVTALIVIVFVIFMLIQQEDLRDRVIRLGGAGQVNLTTQVLDDAAHRVSRYLLAQLCINFGFGVLAGLGLLFLGIPNPLLWGLVAALFRYIPYLGIWIAATMPAIISFAVKPGWVDVPIVFGMYFGIDLLMYNFAEPLLYGSSTGVSPLAILVAAVFWTWLWGPVGLLLATPLTVCVVVIGRHVPKLEFLEVLLGDEPILPVEVRLYQRLLAMDLEEASLIAEEFLKERSLVELYDQVVIPALGLAEEDRHCGRLDEVREQSILQNTRVLIDEMGERENEEKASESKQNEDRLGTKQVETSSAGVDVLCIPARDEADELVALMLEQLAQQRGISSRVLSWHSLAGESLGEISRLQPKAACVLALPPSGYPHARYLCRRLRAQFPALKVIAAVWTRGGIDQLKQRRPQLAADELAANLGQALPELVSLIQVEPKLAAPPAA